MRRGLDAAGTAALKQSWIKTATLCFNWGGLLGTLLTIPLAKFLGRRTMYAIYFACSSAALLATFGLDLPSETRLYMYFFIGLTVFGVFGSFTYYLPELFPTRLRGTGSGFCYNIGRVAAAIGPFLVGEIGRRGGAASLEAAMAVLFYVGFAGFIGFLGLHWVIETKGRPLPE